MKLNDIKIGPRLYLTFGLLAALSASIAGFSVYKLGLIQSNLETVVTKNNAAVHHANEMSQAVHLIGRVIRNVVLLDDKAEMQQQLLRIQKAREAYDKAWAELQKIPADEAAKAARVKLVEVREAARPLNDQVLELGLANKAADATTLLLKSAGPATQRFQDAIAEIIALEEATSAKEFGQAQSEYALARTLLISAGALGLALAGLLGWLITRSITRPLQTAVSVAEAVAAGKLDGEVAVTGRDEEIGRAHV